MNTMQKQFIPKYEDGDVNNYSINKCLVELGAPPDEVYYCKYPVNKQGHYYNYSKTRKMKIYHANRSIYSRYTKDELWNWAKYLYKEKLKEFHPDKHKTNKVFWNGYTAYLGQVFDKVKKILKIGKYAAISYHRSA